MTLIEELEIYVKKVIIAERKSRAGIKPSIYDAMMVANNVKAIINKHKDDK